MSANSQLTVELLGGWRIQGPDGRDVRVSSRKSRALLACLAIRAGAPVSRDELTQLLWENSDAELARASLRQALSALRRALAGVADTVLVCNADAIMLDATAVSSDLQRFRALLRDPSPQSLAQVAELFSSDLLPGFDARSATFDAWLEDHRRVVRHEWALALQRLAAQCLQARDDDGAVRALARLVTVEPVNEPAQRQLMSAYARQGRYTEALRQYRACCEALRQDLDVAPDPATEALYRDLLRRRRAAEPHEPASTTTESAMPPAAAETTPEVATFATLREAVVLVARFGFESTHRADDPEALREAWARAARRFAAVVTELGGASDRPSQGEVIAVFGLAAATGNEVHRALRAARRLTESSADHSEPRLAVGVARGLVLPSGNHDPFPIAGQAVALAQRLARAAGLDSSLLAPDVAAQLPDHMTRATEVRLDDLTGSPRVLLPPTERSPREATELAGRRAELAMLQTLFERVIESRHGRVVVVRGEPGIGKTSLLQALAASAGLRAAVHVTQALDFGQPVGERPRATLAARWLGLVSGPVTPAAALAAIERGVASGLIEHSDVPALLDLMAIAPDAAFASYPASAPDPVARERAQAALMQRLLEHVAAREPQLVIVEDAHWADPTEISQLGDFARAITNQPVLLAISTRVDGDPFSAAWRARARGCPVTTLDLAPLADDEARELAQRYLGVEPARLDRCVDTAAGNPLFLEQLLRSAQAGQDALPGTVRALLLARVEQLPVATQRILHAAATLGLRFNLTALCHVAGSDATVLHDLEAPGLLACDGEDCHFTHALVRAAIYDSLLLSVRTRLHERAAVWFERLDPALHAEHLAAAGSAEAGRAHLRAAEAELQAYRLDRASSHAERALALAKTTDEQCEAQATLGAIYLCRGRTEEAIGAYRATADTSTTASQRARAHLGLATSLRILDRYDEALEILDQAERDAQEEGDRRRLAQVWTLRGNLHFPRGEVEQCLRAHERALKLAREADSTEDIARALGGLSDAHYQRGRMRTALDYVQQCLALSERHGLFHLHLAYLPMAASSYCYCGEFGPAMEATRQTLVAARRAGDLRAELLASSTGASMATYRAEFGLAVERSERSLVLSRQLGAIRFEAEALVLKGAALCRNGDFATGRRVLEQAVECARESALTYCAPWAMAALALHGGNEARGRELLEEGARALARGSVSHNHFEYRAGAIEFMLDVHDGAGALAHAAALSEYTRDEPLPWPTLVIQWAAALAPLAQGQPPDAERVREALAVAETMGFALLIPRLRAALT